MSSLFTWCFELVALCQTALCRASMVPFWTVDVNGDSLVMKKKMVEVENYSIVGGGENVSFNSVS